MDPAVRATVCVVWCGTGHSEFTTPSILSRMQLNGKQFKFVKFDTIHFFLFSLPWLFLVLFF